MADKGIHRLIDEARKSPEFFHDLVWDTEKVLAKIDYLSRLEKAAILSVDPDALVAGLVIGGIGPGPREGCGVSCGGTCGGSCGDSCNGSCGGSCAGSCNSSCNATCAATCLGTSAFSLGGDVVNPAWGGQVGSFSTRVAGQRFSRFRRS